MPGEIASTSIGTKFTEFYPKCRVVLRAEKGHVVLRLLDTQGKVINLTERLRPLVGTKIDLQLAVKVVGG